MSFYNLLCNAQSQSIVIFIRSRWISAIKAVEYFFLFAIGDAGAVVNDGEYNSFFFNSFPRQSADAPLTEHHKICGGYAALEWQKRSWRQSKIAIPPAFSDLTMLFLFLFLRFFFDTEQGIHVRLP